MTTDLFLRTYPKDYPWLRFLFASMVKRVRGFNRLIVVVPGRDTQAELDGVDASPCGSLKAWSDRLREVCAIKHGIVFRVCPVYPNDYVGQQITKMRAWEYSDADEICFLDSDLVFRRAFTPTTLHVDGGPLIETREWASLGDENCWREPTAKLLGQDPPFETMARHPFQYGRSMIQRCYNGVGGEAALLAFSAGQPFSEFNLLGNWAILREGAKPVPVFTKCSTVEIRSEDVCRQFWSHTPIAECEAELRQLGVWEDPA